MRDTGRHTRGRPWTAPDGTEYLVALVNVTGEPGNPAVVPHRWVLRFYRDQVVSLERPLPGHGSGDDLTDDQVLAIYAATRPI